MDGVASYFDRRLDLSMYDVPDDRDLLVKPQNLVAQGGHLVNYNGCEREFYFGYEKKQAKKKSIISKKKPVIHRLKRSDESAISSETNKSSRLSRNLTTNTSGGLTNSEVEEAQGLRNESDRVIKQRNINRFRQEHVEYKNLTNEQVMTIFRVYRTNIERQFELQDISQLVSGTLIILITCLFMNGGAGKEIVYVDEFNGPNNIVMNTVIASATGGLTMVALQQYTNVFDAERIQK